MRYSKQSRWIVDKDRYAERPAVDDFLDDVMELCAQHGFSIRVGETGGFLIVPHNYRTNAELMNAQVRDEEPAE